MKRADRARAWDGAPAGGRTVKRGGWRGLGRPAAAVVLVGLGLGLAPGLALGQEGSDLPTIYVIATGGTISNVDEGERLTGDQIVESVPGVDSLVQFEVEQYTNVASGFILPSDWHAVSNRINELFRARRDLAGVIVTHGTDTMEETAYFLDRTVLDDRPVIVTGAMRNPSLISHDGPANFYNSVRTILHPGAHGRGTMVLLNDEIMAGRQVTKTNTVRRNAFSAPHGGLLGVTDPDSVYFFHDATRRPPPFDVTGVDSLARVDIVYAYAGADGTLMDAAMAAGARGLVIAGVGRGGRTRGQGEATDRALENGVYVVNSSRTMSGHVPVGDAEERMEDWQPGHAIRFGAADLTPQKARILLILGLTETDEARALMNVFRRRR